MLPGKSYTPEDILHIGLKRIWFILVPFAVIAAGTAVWARYLPDRFRSETLIMVVPQQVPESYVRSTVTSKLEDRLQSIRQQMLSRTKLERIIQDFNLYPSERRTQIMEDVVEQMRRDVTIDVPRGDAFRVSFQGDNPRTVMRVTERLASIFIDENYREREIQADGTNQFLESTLEDAHRRLVEQEKKVEEYRRRYSGQLPSQMESNLQLLQNSQLQIQQVAESINRDRDRRLILERQLADAQQVVEVPTPAAASPDITTVGSAAAQLDAAKARLAALEQRLKPTHPDVVAAKRSIQELEVKAADEAAAAKDAQANATQTVRLSPTEYARRKRVEDLTLELAQLDRQIAAKQKQDEQLRTNVAAYQQRVEAIPTRESEMTELMRDYTTMQQMYLSLLQKREESKIAANVERRQIGEQFKVLDPARIPEKPFSPDRQRLNAIGLAAGLAVGLLLVGVLEYRDNTFKNDDDVFRVIKLPVLAVVPTMRSVGDTRRAFRLRILLGLGCGTTVVGCLAIVVYTFVR